MPLCEGNNRSVFTPQITSATTGAHTFTLLGTAGHS